MANITNFANQGVTRSNATFSWKPPTNSGIPAYAYQITIDNGGGVFVFTPSENGELTIFNKAGTGTCFFAVTPGTIYTATIQYSTDPPYGTPFTFSSAGVTTTFSLTASTCGISALIPITFTEPNADYQFFVDAGGNAGDVVCTLTETGGGPVQTKTRSLLLGGLAVSVNFTRSPTATSATLTTTATGVSGGSLSVKPLVQSPLLWPEPGVTAPAITPTQITCYYTTSSAFATSTPFIQFLLWDRTTNSVIYTQAKTYASGSEVITGLTDNHQYTLYCWGCGNAGGGEKVEGASQFEFIAGDYPQPVQNFGMNWFYSPVA